jgi:hypothetical protein
MLVTDVLKTERIYPVFLLQFLYYVLYFLKYLRIILYFFILWLINKGVCLSSPIMSHPLQKYEPLNMSAKPELSLMRSKFDYASSLFQHIKVVYTSFY